MPWTRRSDTCHRRATIWHQLIHRTVAELKSQLLAALSVPSLRTSTLNAAVPHLDGNLTEGDFQMFEDIQDSQVDGQEDVVGYRSIEGDRKEMSKNLRQLGWGRWKRVLIR